MSKKPAEGKRLGRGLAALIGDMDNEAQAIERARSQRRIPIEFYGQTRATRVRISLKRISMI